MEYMVCCKVCSKGVVVEIEWFTDHVGPGPFSTPTVTPVDDVVCPICDTDIEEGEIEDLLAKLADRY